MAFTTATNLEVRTTGSASNGGGFDTSASGMATDLAATSATTSTPVVTSVSYTFIARDVGACVFVQSGTNWIPGWYPITSVSGGAATLGAAVGAVQLYKSASLLNLTAGCASTGSPTSGKWSVDYSQMDAAGIVYSDMVIDGTTNTKYSSAAKPVGVNVIGNIVNVTSGTGFTIQRVQVVSTSGTVATCDKSLGTLSSTGGVGNLGGALQTLASAFALVNTSNTVWLKSGTYATTSTNTLNIGGDLSTGPLTIRGYGTVRGDRGTRPLVTTSTNSTKLIAIRSFGVNTFHILWDRISFSNTASIRAAAITPISGNSANVTIHDCIFDGFTVAIQGDFTTDWSFLGLNVSQCEIKNCTSHAIANNEAVVTNCHIHDNLGDGWNSGTANANANQALFSGTIFARNATAINSSQNIARRVIAYNCSFVSNTGSAISLSSSTSAYVIELESNIFYGNGGYAVNLGVGPVQVLCVSNAYGSNTSGNFNNIGSGISDVILTADPFVNSSGGNYSLNTTAGGGAACKGLGLPSSWPGNSLTLASPDIGAVAAPVAAAVATYFAY